MFTLCHSSQVDLLKKKVTHKLWLIFFNKERNKLTRTKHSSQHCIWVGSKLSWIHHETSVVHDQRDPIFTQLTLLPIPGGVLSRRSRRRWSVSAQVLRRHVRTSSYIRACPLRQPLASFLVPSIFFCVTAAVGVEIRTSFWHGLRPIRLGVWHRRALVPASPHITVDAPLPLCRWAVIESRFSLLLKILYGKKFYENVNATS